MKNFHKINTLFIIGVLSLTLGAVGIINNIHMAEAQCSPGAYGQCVSYEARNDTPYNQGESGVGYGDEVSPLATQDGSFGQDYREAGSRQCGSCSTVGESNIPHDGGNDPLVVLTGN